MTNVKDKERILKAAREKWLVTYKRTPTRLSDDFQQKFGRPEGSGMMYLKSWIKKKKRKEKKKDDLQPEYFTWQGYQPGLKERTSLVTQWIRIHLPVWGTWVWSLDWGVPTFHGATKPMYHNYWAHFLDSESHNYWVHMLRLRKPTHLEPVLHNKRCHHNEKSAHRSKEWPPLTTPRQSLCTARPRTSKK